MMKRRRIYFLLAAIILALAAVGLLRTCAEDEPVVVAEVAPQDYTPEPVPAVDPDPGPPPRDPDPGPIPAPAPGPEPKQGPEIFADPETERDSEPKPKNEIVAEAAPEIAAVQATEIRQEKEAKPFRLALKTNMLFDVLATPNVELEIPFAHDKFSVMGEFWFPWWVGKDNSWCYQLLYGGVETRWWFQNRTGREALSGHFLGLYGGAGKFDLEYGNIGYQNKCYWSAGLTYGYSFPVWRSFRIETSVSFGYLDARYAKYEAVEDGKFLAWMYDGHFTWLGPTKAKVSLVWTLF